MRGVGASGAPTPHLDALAVGGVVFEAAYAAHPTRAESLLSLQAGRLLPRRAADLDPEARDSLLSRNLVGALRASGRDVAMIGSPRDLADRHGLADCSVEGGRDAALIAAPPGAPGDADGVAERAAAWIAGRPGLGRWTAFVFLSGPGDALGAAEETPARLAALDARIGRLVGAVDDSGAAAETLILYASLSGAAVDPVAGAGLSEAVIGAPLLMRGPGAPVGGRVRTAVSLLDLYPTLLAAARAPIPAAIPGESLLAMTEVDRPGRPVMAVHHGSAPGRDAFMMRLSRFKLVQPAGGAPQLFDLADDPDERRDRAADPAYAEALTACRAALARRLPIDDRPVAAHAP